MKNRFFWILSALLLWAINTRGASISATITVTHVPTSGAPLVINGNTRTWTNTASSPVASWIVIGSGTGGSATNLYNHIAANPYVGPFLTLGRVGTNAISLFSPNGVLSITTNEWMEVTYSTNQTTSVYALSVPPWNVPGNTNRTNNGHWLVDYLNDYVYTNSIRTNANVASNYLTRGASPQQVVVSPVLFNSVGGTNSGLTNGVLHGQRITNAVGISGSVYGFTNGYTTNQVHDRVKMTNGVNYGDAFSSPGAGANSDQFGNGATAAGAQAFAAGPSASAGGSEGIAIGNSALSGTPSGNTVVGASATTFYNPDGRYGQSATAIGTSSRSSGTNSGALFQGAISDYNDAYAIAGTADSTNQIKLGSSSLRVSIPGQLLISGTQSNTTFRGTNIAGGSWSFPRADLSSIANGNNISIPIGTNQFVRLSGTVTASPSLCGFIGAATSGGNDGQWVALFNDLGYAAVLAQNTVDPVAANRIETADGNDVTVAANGWATLRYSSSDSRWHIENYYPQVVSASATNALSVIGTNTVPISGSVTGLFFWPGANMTINATNTSGRVDILLTSGAGGGSGVATQLFVGKTYYLDNAVAAASDANVGTNLAAPLLTVSNAFNRLSSGDTLYIRPGTYTVAAFGETHFTAWSDRTNAPLRLPALTNVTIEGTGPGSLIQWSGVGNLISLWQCDGITFRNIRLKGPGKNLNQSANTWTNIMGAIVMWNAGPSQVTGGDGTNYNIRLEGCVIEDFPDHGIIGIPGSENYGVTVVNNLFRRGGEAYHPTMDRDGAAVVPGASRVVVSGNRFEDVQHAIEFEQSFGASPGTMSDISIIGNIGKNLWHHGITIWPGAYETKNVLILGNVMECIPTNHPAITVGSVGIQAVGGSGTVIAENALRGGWNYGISASASLTSSNGVISHNTIISDGDSAGNLAIGISLQTVTNTVATNYMDGWMIEGNSISGADDFAAIYVSGKNNVIRGNLIGNTTGSAHGVQVVFVTSCTNNVIQGNVFFGIGGGGTNIVVGVGVTNTILANNTTTTPKARWIADSGIGTRYSWVWSEPLAAGSNISFSTNETTGEITIASTGGGAATNAIANLNGLGTNTTLYGNLQFGDGSGAGITTISNELFSNRGYYFLGVTTNANDAYFQGSIWQGLSGGATLRADLLRVSGTSIFTNNVQTLASHFASGGVGANFIDVTNDFRARSNTYHFGTNDFYKTVRFVNVATNKLLFNDANTNLTGLGLGANLSISGGNLVASGTGGGTNFPAILRGNPAVATALNGPGTRQIVTWETNASFEMAFSGAPLNGQEFEIGVANTNTSTIYMTNTSGIFDPTVASNVTTFAIAGTSARWFTFKSSTNWNLGVARWELHNTIGKEFELAATSPIGFSTNAAGTIITITNTSAILGNLAGTGALTNNVLGGWGIALSTNAGVTTVVQTNRIASVATNATSVTLDFSDAVNINTLNTWFHLTTNLVVSPTNLVRGRTMCVYFDTNSLTYDVVITNTAATQVRWNFNVSTNGSTSFTKTNSLRARVFLTYETNDVLTAEMGYYR